jgi:hypothetical protein
MYLPNMEDCFRVNIRALKKGMSFEEAMAETVPILVCLYEDRPYQIPGLKILLITLTRHCPSWPIRLRFPAVPDSFRDWLNRFSQISLHEEKLPSWGSFNVKPSVLMDGLTSGAEACLWLDTDVLVNGNLDFIAASPPETIVVTQDPWEYKDGSTHRSETWGLVAGRQLPGPLNSSVVYITRHHENFLQSWHSILTTQSYLEEQAKPVSSRNPHVLSDQDGLSALLASMEFAEIPVLRLQHAAQILQHHGAGAYGLRQRWTNLTRGMPPLVHAMGTIKPWRMPKRPWPLQSPRDYYERTYLELSPYVHFSREYVSLLDEDTDWMKIRTLSGRIGNLLGMKHPALKGAGQSVIHRMLSPR